MKSIANAIKNTATFERTLLSRAVCKQIDTLSEPDLFCDRLLHGKEDAELADLLRVEVASWSNRGVINGMNLSASDIIDVDGQFFEVDGCIGHSRKVYVACHGLVCVERITAVSSRWRRGREPEALSLVGKRLRLADAWYYDGDDIIVACMG